MSCIFGGCGHSSARVECLQEHINVRRPPAPREISCNASAPPKRCREECLGAVVLQWTACIATATQYCKEKRIYKQFFFPHKELQLQGSCRCNASAHPSALRPLPSSLCPLPNPPYLPSSLFPLRVRSQRSGGSGQKSEVRGRKSEVRHPSRRLLHLPPSLFLPPYQHSFNVQTSKHSREGLSWIRRP